MQKKKKKSKPKTNKNPQKTQHHEVKQNKTKQNIPPKKTKNKNQHFMLTVHNKILKTSEYRKKSNAN